MRSEGYSTLFVCHCVCVVCVCVCLIQHSRPQIVDRALKFQHQRSVDDTLESFDSWILLKLLRSRDMAKSVSQEAYERASLPDQQTSAHVITLQ